MGSSVRLNGRLLPRAMLGVITIVITITCITPALAVDEIVVTVRKKQENLQEVPIAIDVLSAEQIQTQGIRNLADITRNTPSVIFDESFNAQDTKVTIRGVPNTRGRSNVAFLIDGIDVTSLNFLSL